MLIRTFFQTLSTLTKPYAFKFVIMTVMVAILAFIAFIIAMGWAAGFLEAYIAFEHMEWVGAAGATIVGYFLFPLILPLVSLLFLDAVADNVEKAQYPEVYEKTKHPLWESIKVAVIFTAIAIPLNLLLLLFIFFGPLYFIAYYVINGYLFGREYFEMIALRYNRPNIVRKHRKEHFRTIWLLGAAIAFSYTIPMVNLFIPLISVIWMMHVFFALPQPRQLTQKGAGTHASMKEVKDIDES